MNRDIESIIYQMRGAVQQFQYHHPRYSGTIVMLGRRMTRLGMYMLEPLIVKRFEELKETEKQHIYRRWLEAGRIVELCEGIPDDYLTPEELAYEDIAMLVCMQLNNQCWEFGRELGRRAVGCWGSEEQLLEVNRDDAKD